MDFVQKSGHTCLCPPGVELGGFSISVIIRFQVYLFFEPSALLVWEIRHMCSQIFLYEIQFRTTFIWSFFWCDVYFWQRWALKLIQFPISIHYKILNIRLFEALLPPLVREIDMCAHWLFWTKCNAQILLFEQFSNIISNFGSVQPENSHLSTTLSLKHTTLSSPLAPARGRTRHKRPLTFLMKFNSQKLLFEQFFYIIGNFGRVLP